MEQSITGKEVVLPAWFITTTGIPPRTIYTHEAARLKEEGR
jgi:hypothetical protein